MDSRDAGIFVAGGAVGACATCIIMHLTHGRRFRKAVEKEVNDILSTEKGKISHDGAKNRGTEAEKEQKADHFHEEAAKVVTNYSEMASREAPTEEAGAESEDSEGDDEDEDARLAEEYDELVKNYELVTEENENDVAGYEMTKEMNSGKKPRLITDESFDNEYPHFDKVQLEYYVGNDCLVEVETNEAVLDEEKVVGDCLDKFGFRTNDEEVIFVRNFSYSTDYEISKVYNIKFGEI